MYVFSFFFFFFYDIFIDTCFFLFEAQYPVSNVRYFLQADLRNIRVFLDKRRGPIINIRSGVKIKLVKIELRGKKGRAIGFPVPVTFESRSSTITCATGSPLFSYRLPRLRRQSRTVITMRKLRAVRETCVLAGQNRWRIYDRFCDM